MEFNSLLSLLVSLSIFTVLSTLLPHHALADNNTQQLPGLCSMAVIVQGYKCQEYEVTTDDGYIISVQRIPKGQNGSGSMNKTPVLLQHGILVDGATWLLNSPEQSLAFMLADNGFDVWISNGRGTQYSKRHVTLNASEPEYWNWSWDELAAHDTPSVINLIVQQTGQKPHYAGHSMGTLTALVSLSQGGFQNVKSVALLSPIAYLSHMKSQLAIEMARLFLGDALETLGFAEFNPQGGNVSDFIAGCCALPGVHCLDITTALTGPNCCLKLNSTSDGVILKNEPQPTSMKNLVHLSQTVRDGVLSKYDYGNALSNWLHYKSFSPPVYDLSRIPKDFPMFVSYGGEDALGDDGDVATLLGILKSHDADKLQVQHIPEYAHLDFVMGFNANSVLYGEVIDFFHRYD